MERLNINKNKGITLIALIITIIVLLILAGVSIAMLTGENGILTQAKKAKEETKEVAIEEENRITDYEDYISKYTNGGYVESKGVNAPVLGENMKLISYNVETKTWEENNSSSSYDYVAGEETADNNKSKWANAKVTIDGVDSYFVWIPRYAYKITYNDINNKSAGGTIDVKFLVGTSDNYYDENGELRKAKRAVTGKEDTTSDYYVHPAFTNNVDLGGWDKELTGIWIGKYEASLMDKESKENVITTETGETSGDILLSINQDKTLVVQEGKSPWRYCTVGNMYLNARTYSEKLNSHLLKNSEWGAVVYLTHSQYGRNGSEIDVNDNSNHITADEGIEKNLEQSSTGNIYGVYDLSGGTHEYTSTYYNSGSENLIEYGKSFIDLSNEDKKTTISYNSEDLNIAYKIGDATFETNGWNNDTSLFMITDTPFLCRGGNYNGNNYSGIFNFNRNIGYGAENFSFRICIITE